MRTNNRKIRSAMRHDERLLASRRICLHILDSQLYSAADTIAAYLAFGDEVDLATLVTAALAERPMKRLTLPRMAPGTVGSLTMHLADMTDLESPRYGPRQPQSEAPRVRPAELDLVLVPGLAFDRSGGRLGYGRGYYDRLLAQVPHSTARIGVSFDALVVDRVPLAGHDATLTHLVTESGLSAIVDRPDHSWQITDRR